MRWLLLLLLPLLVLPASGLRLSGQLYVLGAGLEFEVADETVVVEALSDGDLAARAVASRGSYAMELGAGNYRIVVRSSDGDTRASENVSLRADSRLDLLLLPDLSLPESVLNTSLLTNLTPPESRPPPGPSNWPWILTGAIAVAGVGAFLWMRRGPSPPPSTLPPPGLLPGDLQAMVRVLREEGGRATQKELRKRLGYSEAKVSLMVADLENRGLVRKFKVGRGNIVVLEQRPEEAFPPPAAPQSDVKRNEES